MANALDSCRACRFTAQPTSSYMPGANHFDAHTESALEEEREWVENLKRIPPAKLLINHFAAFESITRSGGQKGMEPAVDQVGTWRRIFCHQLKQSNSPLGISREDGKLPKCIAICNLSGQHAVYFSESFSLARILCLVPQEAQARVIAGVSKVIAKAAELDASIWVGFCLPFQVGLERCHWEIRTVRKTRNGRVKDGEMVFTCHDKEASCMGCTETAEHWPDEMLNELASKLMSVVGPVCLDRQGGGEERTLTPERMAVALDILKTDRKRLQEQHKQKIDSMRDEYKATVEVLENRAVTAEQKADVRISSVLKAAEHAKETAIKKNTELEKHVAALGVQLSVQRNAADDAKARMAGMVLKHEEECVAHAARQKTLEAQVSSMSSNNARTVANHTRQREETAKQHAVAIKALEQSLAVQQKKVASLSSVSSAMSASAKEAHAHLSACKRENRVLRGMLALGRLRHAELETVADKAAVPPVVDAQERATHESEIDSLKAELDKARRDSCIEMGKKEHLIAELTKRVKSLDARIQEAEAENHSLAAKVKPKGPRPPADPTPTSSSTVTVSQNTVFMQPPHQQAFPPGPYILDPALEGMISQLHNALGCITAMARTAKSSARSSEVAHAKLEALTGGMAYHDAQQQQFFYGHGY